MSCARASSSRMLTPTAAASRVASSTRPTNAPATRSASISEGVRSSITSPAYEHQVSVAGRRFYGRMVDCAWLGSATGESHGGRKAPRHAHSFSEHPYSRSTCGGRRERNTMHILDSVDAASLRSDIPDFRAGDNVKVHVNIIEGTRSRIQVFQGVVIGRSGEGIRETFTVRKISFQVGVERTFPVHSPVIDHIELVTRGDVRRAKLYYLRNLRGKKAKIKEKRDA